MDLSRFQCTVCTNLITVEQTIEPLLIEVTKTITEFCRFRHKYRIRMVILVKPVLIAMFSTGQENKFSHVVH